jgi:hypothetical protein
MQTIAQTQENASVVIDWLAVAQFIAAQDERFQRGIPTIASDREFFEKNERRARRRGGWRSFRVRPAAPEDHWVFKIGKVETEGFITIVTRDRGWRYLLAKAEDRFGCVIDSDAYAGMRIDAFSHERQRLSC